MDASTVALQRQTEDLDFSIYPAVQLALTFSRTPFYPILCTLTGGKSHPSLADLETAVERSAWHPEGILEKNAGFFKLRLIL